MKIKKLARTYAHAISQNLRDDLQDVQMHLFQFARCMQTVKDLESFLMHPSVLFQDKKDLINEILQISGIQSEKEKEIYFFLLEQNRIFLMSTIAEELKKISDEKLGFESGTIESARELNNDEILVLEKKFSERLKKSIRLSLVVNPDLLAGIKVIVSGKSYDGSLKGQLSLMEQHLSF